jgi:Na+-exporting ATPase
MGLSFGISDYIEGGVITAVILLNIVVGYVDAILVLAVH